MRFLYFIFVFFISCSVLKKSPEVSISAPPDNVMIVIEEGQSVYVPVGDVLDSNDVTRFSDTLTTLATKSEIGTGGLAGFQNSNDSTILSTSSMDYPIRRDIVTFDIPDSIQGTFPVGTLIRTRGFYSPGDGAGALYQVQSDSIAGYVNDTAAVVPLTSGYAILQPQNGQYDVRWFGAVGDNTTNNGGLIQKANSFVKGNDILFISRGRFLYDETIEIAVNGLKIKGIGLSNTTTSDGAYGSLLKYIGTGHAIAAVSGTSGGQSRPGRIILRDFALIGTDSAQNAIMLDAINIVGVSFQSDKIENVGIYNFSNSLSYGIYLTRVYEMSIDNIRIWDCDNGIYLGDESVNTTITNFWIRNPNLHGIHCVYGLNSMNGGIIDYSGSPDVTQRAIYSASQLNVRNTHFEGNYIAIETTSGAEMVISENKFNSFVSTNAIFADGARIRLIGNILPSNTSTSTGLGTEWVGGIEGQYTPPNVTADNPIGFATRTNLDGSGGAFTLTTYQKDAVPSGPFTLYFLDDSVEVAYSPSAGQRIITKDGISFKGYTGDRLIMQKRQNLGGLVTIEEVARIRHEDNYMQNRTSDYSVKRGEHGLTFTNKGATDTVTFTLPNPLGRTGDIYQNLEFTFIKLDSDPMRIKTTGSPRRIRGGSSGSYLYLSNVGSTVTLRLDSLFYEIVSSGGMYTFSDPDPGNEGGNFAGIGLGELQDSLGLLSYTAGRILYGTGTATLGNTNLFTYNSSAGTNARAITLANGNLANMYIGMHSASNVPGITGYQDMTFATTQPALSLLARKHGGSFGTPTDFTEPQASLLSITAQAYRSNGYRNASGINFGGDNLMSGAGYSGYIGFSTATGATYARRATMHRNGDFYLGDGLPTNDLASPSSKLLLRGNGTTTGNLFLAEDSNGDDKFILQDNGTITLPVSPTLNNTADSVIVRNNVTGSLEVRSATSISGGFQAYTAQSSTYNVTASDNIIECTANSFTLNFPSAVGLTGKEWTVKNTGVGTITIEPDGAETIDGQPNTTLTTQYESITIFSNGANLLIK